MTNDLVIGDTTDGQDASDTLVPSRRAVVDGELLAEFQREERVDGVEESISFDPVLAGLLPAESLADVDYAAMQGAVEASGIVAETTLTFDSAQAIDGRSASSELGYRQVSQIDTETCREFEFRTTAGQSGETRTALSCLRRRLTAGRYERVRTRPHPLQGAGRTATPAPEYTQGNLA